MEPTTVRSRIVSQIQHMAQNAIIRDRRFLDDEQLIRSEQMAVLEEIFNANVRDAEIRELSSHFAEILRGGHPVHLATWGKTGTGKTLTLSYFLNLLGQMCRAEDVPMRHEHLDLSAPRPCFRALNDLACLLGASKRYKKGISLEELMLRIEAVLADYRGYLILVFASNRLDWPENLDPRIKSFLKLNELIFKPYDAVDLKHILRIRVDKALAPEAVRPGVVEKIAAMAGVIQSTRRAKGRCVGTGEAYDAYQSFCQAVGLRALTGRAFGDLIAELDVYCLLRSRVHSRGRYGRTREIALDLPADLVDKIQDAIRIRFDLRTQTTLQSAYFETSSK